jgi:Cu-Zn family superoxide dismutase
MNALYVLLITLITSIPQMDANTTNRIDLPGDSLFPEGIAADGDDIYVGGLGDGSIVRIQGNSAEYFREPGTDRLRNVIGLAVDERRRRLFVCATPFIINGQVNHDPKLTSEIIVYDLDTQKLIKRLSPPVTDEVHLFNDITVANDGTAYVTDTRSPIIWRISKDLEILQPWLRSEKFLRNPMGFNLNGITVTPDQRALIASVPGSPGALFHIDLETGDINEITIEPASENASIFPGADGLLFLNDKSLLMVKRGLWMVDFGNNYLYGNWRQLHYPIVEAHFGTTAAMRADGDIAIVLSQLDRMIGPDAHKGPELPFQLLLLSKPSLLNKKLNLKQQL